MTGNEKGLASFPATNVTVQHTRIATGLSYDELVGGFERELGRWDLAAADRLLKSLSKASWSRAGGRSHGWPARPDGPHPDKPG
jgi:hypothetical protein